MTHANPIKVRQCDGLSPRDTDRGTIIRPQYDENIQDECNGFAVTSISYSGKERCLCHGHAQQLLETLRWCDEKYTQLRILILMK